VVTVLENVKTSARAAGRKLADRSTPFIFECWYVAGFSEEFSRTLKARTLLGRPLVFFRTEAGAPVALDDRCVHRSFPLSKSRLEGDTIVCGYHGARYDVDGACVQFPSQPHAPNGLGVRTYTLFEQGPLMWIWMGQGPADPAEIPDISSWTTSPQWVASRDYFDLKASYVALHENLLDLSHLSYLHSATFGTPDYALAPVRNDIREAEGKFAVMRDVVPTRLPPLWAKSTGIIDRDAARIARSDFLSPALHVIGVRFWDCALPEDKRPDMQIRTAHIPTPATQTSTHYFIYHARNFAVGDSDITRFMHEQLVAAFNEDIDGLEAIEEMYRQTPPDELFEVSFAADRAGVAMRRYLLARAQREAR
jgi:nitrite reductase/ring-hydroxylating ferredoxin subunit